MLKARAPRTKADWLIPASLVVLSIVPVIAGVSRLSNLVGDRARSTSSPLASIAFSGPSSFRPDCTIVIPAGAAMLAACSSPAAFSPPRRASAGARRMAEPRQTAI